MRTTVDLPVTLLQQAQAVTGAKTKRAVLIQALQSLIDRENRKGITNFFGDTELDIDLETLRGRA